MRPASQRSVMQVAILRFLIGFEQKERRLSAMCFHGEAASNKGMHPTANGGTLIRKT